MFDSWTGENIISSSGLDLKTKPVDVFINVWRPDTGQIGWIPVGPGQAKAGSDPDQNIPDNRRLQKLAPKF